MSPSADYHRSWASEAEERLRGIVKDQARTIQRLEQDNFALRCEVTELKEQLERKPLAEVKRIAR